MSRIPVSLLAFACSVSFSLAEKMRIEFHDGAIVEAEVVKATQDKLFLDLGFEILSVPKDEVARSQKLEDSKNAKSLPDHESLFTNSHGKKVKSLRTLVKELGESVVLVRTAIGLGSGFLIHEDGYLITNDHVVAGEREVSVTQFLSQGNQLRKVNFDDVEIIATGGNLDLALLKIKSSGKNQKFPFLELGESSKLNQGERVFAIGSPLGLERSVSEGIVSLRNRIIADRLHVQSTAEISPGNSGGPLFNYRGEVVGVNNMKVIAQGAEGLGFAIPVDSLKTFLSNRDAYAFDPRNPNAGFRYTVPPQGREAKPKR